VEVAILTNVAPQKPGADASPAQKPSDRRVNRRIELEVEIGMESDHNFYTGLTRDISTGGIFVATAMTYDVGHLVRVTFSLPGQPQALVVESQVAWVRDPRTVRTDGPEGMGLKFLNLSPESQAVIGDFLEKRDSIFYDDDH
jgi:uncharacterized protein (TIGR02266 family)